MADFRLQQIKQCQLQGHGHPCSIPSIRHIYESQMILLADAYGCYSDNLPRARHLVSKLKPDLQRILLRCFGVRAIIINPIVYFEF